MKDLSKPQVTWLEVGEESEAQRIDNFLLRQLKGVPKSHVYRVLRSGEVRVNSGRVKPDYRVRIGDKVRIPPIRVAAANPKPPAKPFGLPIVHEDSSLLVVDKPSGVAVHGGSGVSFGVIELLRAARPEAKLLELAHRLDRDTSGLLIVAKKRSALVELHRMLRDGEVEKIYVAVVKGVPAKKQFDISDALHKYVNAKGERRVAVKEGGMAAVTRIKLLAEQQRRQPAPVAPHDRPHPPDPRAPRACRPPGARRRQVRRFRTQPRARAAGREAAVPACAPAWLQASRRRQRDDIRVAAAGGHAALLRANFGKSTDDKRAQTIR